MLGGARSRPVTNSGSELTFMPAWAMNGESCIASSYKEKTRLEEVSSRDSKTDHHAILNY